METNLKAIELRDLWRRYKDEKDEKARERLVLAYAPLVKYVAGRMSSGLPSHVEEADLISYGLLGLISAIARLPEREKLVVALYYYENLTLREIGEVLGVTESRVSQLHTKAVLRLKSRLQGDPISEAG